ncbi:hypothetical protein EJ05DRAFT_394990 [Pseudovirgaria hyperparasitica]|uniref:Uncharacterized protein n=1 Tax=Pseudovirgaria hyperparasitica TaxID=470096 RepID=A0A6A6W7P1_9PEZI|nr:uncharacterized protein EJ05DRAFT_394990 [Pseudovirgaria hyperparasitica]KAF2757597.1 hypothetical protein EJ05DRAFT_394990 [Pseudovirgaria hyperparasitica]
MDPAVHSSSSALPPPHPILPFVGKHAHAPCPCRAPHSTISDYIPHAYIHTAAKKNNNNNNKQTNNTPIRPMSHRIPSIHSHSPFPFSPLSSILPSILPSFHSSAQACGIHIHGMTLTRPDWLSRPTYLPTTDTQTSTTPPNARSQ